MNLVRINKDELERLDIKIVLMTANEIEREELNKRMVPHNDGQLRQYFDGDNDFILGYFGRYHIAHIHCKQHGSLGPEASMLTLESALEVINPDIIIMVGVAYGANKNTQKIGDVLISESIRSTDMLKRLPHNQVENRNENFLAGEKIVNILTNLQIKGIEFNIIKGMIISGEALINDEEYKENLISIFKEDKENIIGGEMEGIGLASLLKRKNINDWVLIKGISDWADGRKDENKDKNQHLAVKNALYVCWRMLVQNEIANLFPSSTLVFKKQYHKARVFVNGYMLFYYRMNVQLGKRGLEKKVKNKNITIKELENTNGDIFRTAGYHYVNNLQKTLGCKNYELMNIDTPDHIKEYYKRKTGKNSLFPINNSKIVVFDFDGTLTRKKDYCSTWELIWLELGYTIDQCAALHRKFSNNDINHKQWCDQTAEYFKEKKLDKGIINNVIAKINLVNGIKETFEILKSKGIKIYICSGSIDYIINKVLGDELLGFIDEISANEFLFTEKDMFKSIRGTDFDFENKAKFIEKIVKENKCKPSDVLFVGNSLNDQYVYKSNARTLVVNPKLVDPHNRKVFNYLIKEMNNLTDILKYAIPEEY
jgi:HAD superfamily phosphoserine phosphatase-like hydrolase